MIRRPPRSTLFPYTTPSDLTAEVATGPARSRARHVDPFADLKRTVHQALLESLGPTLYDARMTQSELETKDRKSTRLNSSHANISYAVFCLKKKNNKHNTTL